MVPRRSHEGQHHTDPAQIKCWRLRCCLQRVPGEGSCPSSPFAGPDPTLLRFSLAFECGCGLPEEPALLCSGNVPPPSWGCRGGKQELKPWWFNPCLSSPGSSIRLPAQAKVGSVLPPSQCQAGIAAPLEQQRIQGIWAAQNCHPGDPPTLCLPLLGLEGSSSPLAPALLTW